VPIDTIAQQNSYGQVNISVVIPAFNAAEFIGETIESVLAQTYEVSEIIVVDDGSTDQTAEVASKFPKTRVIRRPNGGQGAARNTGIQAALSEWIAFLDHDDIWHARKTESQIPYATPGIGVIHANRFDPITFGSLWHRQAHITPSGAMVRKQALIDVGGFEESREVMGVEDLNLWLRIAMTDWGFARSERGLFQWRSRGTNQSANDFRMARAELENLARIGEPMKCSWIPTLQRAVRLEYARNLIAGRQRREALKLLGECRSGMASLFLRLVALSGLRRMARVDVLKWLLSVERMFHMRGGCMQTCTLPREKREACAMCSRALPMRQRRS
jgi:hypothetical protein